MNLGNAIRLCRVQKNMSQTQLATQAGISVSYLSLLERGKRDPNLSTIQSICEALKVPINVLMFIASDPNDIAEISPEMVEKLSYMALKLIKATNH